ncbi:MAG: acetyl-CoA carboxylase biotin carboxyl carrier protein subunit [Modestobacter sp.]|nr:acetyl-CoA carboxylase biotin carboxyl carrier protein subunit [Modestobacter sp.]
MIDRKELQQVLEVLSEGGWQHAHIVTPDFTLTLVTPTDGATQAAPPVPLAAITAEPVAAAASPVPQASAPAHLPPVAAPAPAGVSAAVDADVTVVTAPSIGVIWRSPKPGAPPFVEPGQVVAPDDTVCLLEVMKLFTPIKAEVAGRVAALHVDNGDMVQFGTPLLSIEAM